MEDADDGRVAARQHSRDAAGAASVAAARGFVDQHLVALHGAVELVRRDEEVEQYVNAEA